MTLYAFITENSDLLKKECIVEREVFYDDGGSGIKAVSSGKLKKTRFRIPYLRCSTSAGAMMEKF